MAYANIALIGRARSGKDTVASHLIRQYAYTRVAFADPLRDMALRIDPIVSTRFSGGDDFALRLSRCVEIYGWERAKDQYPEVRRILQHVGQTVRDLDEDFWLRAALDKISVARRWNYPVVVTDCRYPNEAEALKGAGFKLVRIVRPEADSVKVTHESETALADWPCDAVIFNNEGLNALYAQAEAVAEYQPKRHHFRGSYRKGHTGSPVFCGDCDKTREDGRHFFS